MEMNSMTIHDLKYKGKNKEGQEPSPTNLVLQSCFSSNENENIKVIKYLSS